MRFIGLGLHVGSLDPSHVLMALGMKHSSARSLRMTLGKDNTMQQTRSLDTCRASSSRLREMSPIYAEGAKCHTE